MTSNLLSDESIMVLRGLIGVTIHTIFAPNLDAAGAHLAAWALSLLIEKDSYVNFSCKWSETPYFLNDSWLIQVSQSSDPLRIVRDASGALVGPCTISIYNAQPITRIEIFEYQDKTDDDGGKESVHYDRALLFHCHGDKKFCISCMLNGPGIAEYLHFSENDRVIEEMISDCTIRVALAGAV